MTQPEPPVPTFNSMLICDRVEFLKSAARQLAALPTDRQRNLAQHIDRLRESASPIGSMKLEGDDRLHRLRVGDYRVVYDVDEPAKVVTVVKIGHRRDVYRNLQGPEDRSNRYAAVSRLPIM
jgi:mRNA interferase RelE/StbE